ncbi:MAG: molybdopterin molybdotransferase [Archaeoglobi archaeon]|nr:molybdopterin molybdotransferase MoeA [Candidatus Mnemosynella bozhongmuii]MDI3502255.1 molybdopterin molybdotransferase [Archaeoglobi archaeon]MDK2781955.1 molybdopterin molybdotransferase [Archaeoglobi archaeon]
MEIKETVRVEDALKIIFDNLNPAVREVPVEEALGCALAEEVVSPVDCPPFDRAAMDGFAVRARDTYGASQSSPVIMEISDRAAEMKAVPVNTGERLPEGTDAVVMVEDVLQTGDFIEVFSEVHPGKNVARRGEDVERGEIIFEPSHVMRCADIALLKALGIEKIRVFSRPKVSIIPTGSEFFENSGIRETNSLMIALLLKKWGSIPEIHGVVRDDEAELKRAICDSLSSDIIAVIGGTSAGKRDLLWKVLDEIGEPLFRGVAMSPGRPTLFGLVDGKPLLGLPGYPVACLMSALTFLREMVGKLMNRRIEERTIKARLISPVTSKAGYRTFTRVKLRHGMAIPVMTHGSGILSSVTRADGYIVVPEEIEGFEADEIVEVRLFE